MFPSIPLSSPGGAAHSTPLQASKVYTSPGPFVSPTTMLSGQISGQSANTVTFLGPGVDAAFVIDTINNRFQWAGIQAVISLDGDGHVVFTVSEPLNFVQNPNNAEGGAAFLAMLGNISENLVITAGSRQSDTATDWVAVEADVGAPDGLTRNEPVSLHRHLTELNTALEYLRYIATVVQGIQASNALYVVGALIPGAAQDPNATLAAAGYLAGDEFQFRYSAAGQADVPVTVTVTQDDLATTVADFWYGQQELASAHINVESFAPFFTFRLYVGLESSQSTLTIFETDASVRFGFVNQGGNQAASGSTVVVNPTAVIVNDKNGHALGLQQALASLGF